MEGDENVSLQRAERGSGSTGGIKKKATRTRGKQKGTGHRQGKAAREAVLRLAAGVATSERELS